MTVQEYIAGQTERTAEFLAHFIATTPADKQQWQPQVEGSAPTRSALEQAEECVSVNRRIAAVLRGETPPAPDPAAPPFTIATADEAKTLLAESAAELSAVIRTLTAEGMAKTYTLRSGQFVGENLIMMPLRNMIYHVGQINLIQMLCGDPEFHLPPNWR